ncbi:NUDIX domain-containing protein [Zoogloea sp.]|uniref:NUDIX domain-containing protein n=1 Tax=Zoogloea sp. TaxID=49181 RepID=UPI0035AFBF83
MSQASWRFCPQCGSPLEWGHVAGAERQACYTPACGFVRWDNPLPVVAAVIECVDRDGAILLARNHAWPERMFALVTGFLEKGESPEDAVAREVKEEVNLDAVSVRLLGTYPFLRKNELLIGYHVQARGDIVLNEELAEFRLVAPDRLRPWPQATGQAVRDWMLSRGMVLPEIVEGNLFAHADL